MKEKIKQENKINEKIKETIKTCFPFIQEFSVFPSNYITI